MELAAKENQKKEEKTDEFLKNIMNTWTSSVKKKQPDSLNQDLGTIRLK